MSIQQDRLIREKRVMISDFRLIDYIALLRKEWLYAFILVIAGGMGGYFYGN